MGDCKEERAGGPGEKSEMRGEALLACPVPSRHDPDQVQRVPAVSTGGVSQLP